MKELLTMKTLVDYLRSEESMAWKLAKYMEEHFGTDEAHDCRVRWATWFECMIEIDLFQPENLVQFLTSAEESAWRFARKKESCFGHKSAHDDDIRWAVRHEIVEHFDLINSPW